MTSTFPHELKEFVLKDFQKHLDENTKLNVEKLSVEDFFYFFHETNVEEKFNELLIDGDIKAINEYLHRNLDVLNFFSTKNYNETDEKKAVKELVNYVKEQKLKREKIFNN